MRGINVAFVLEVDLTQHGPCQRPRSSSMRLTNLLWTDCPVVILAIAAITSTARKQTAGNLLCTLRD